MKINSTKGVFDCSHFKALFLIGCPGSGRNYILRNILTDNTLVEINSDLIFDYFKVSNNFSNQIDDLKTENLKKFREKVKKIIEARFRLIIQNRKGFVFNCTGGDFNKYENLKNYLKELGYETLCLYIFVDDQTSRRSNNYLRDYHCREMHEAFRAKEYINSEALRPELARLFRDRYIEFDNSYDLISSCAEEVYSYKREELFLIFKEVEKFTHSFPKSQKSLKWIANKMFSKGTSIPVAMDDTNPNVNVYDKAYKLGLTFYGFGRYGKNGKITHFAIYNHLVKISSKSFSCFG